MRRDPWICQQGAAVLGSNGTFYLPPLSIAFFSALLLSIDFSDVEPEAVASGFVYVPGFSPATGSTYTFS